MHTMLANGHLTPPASWHSRMYFKPRSRSALKPTSSISFKNFCGIMDMAKKKNPAPKLRHRISSSSKSPDLSEDTILRLSSKTFQLLRMLKAPLSLLSRVSCNTANMYSTSPITTRVSRCKLAKRALSVAGNPCGTAPFS